MKENKKTTKEEVIKLLNNTPIKIMMEALEDINIGLISSLNAITSAKILDYFNNICSSHIQEKTKL